MTTKIDVTNVDTKDYYEEAYGKYGFHAQRRYPNEEFLRFLGRNFSKLSPEEKSKLKLLEVGCGAGANLWVPAREGFDTHGQDISSEGIELCGQMMKYWGVEAKLFVGSMVEIPFEDNSLDIIVDVFSSYCLNETEFKKFLLEINRVLKPGGKFFSYQPSKNSDAYKNHAPAVKIDDSTLNGIFREGSPYACNNHDCRFIYPDEYKIALEKAGFKVPYIETVSRTYSGMCEYFEFVTVEAQK